MRFRWFAIEPERLAQLPLLPAFLPHGLAHLPTSVVHLVQRDDKRERAGIDDRRD